MAREFLSGANLKGPLLLDGSAGTTGQVPLSQGPGVPPAWGSVAGQMELLAVDTYTTAWYADWSKHPDAKIVIVIAVGGGGGGASGGASVNVALGGTGGGGAGSKVQAIFPASILAETEVVYVGKGGVGGAAVTRTAASTNVSTVGNPGQDGESSTFGKVLFTKPGQGGTVNTSTTLTGGGGIGAQIIAAHSIPVEIGGNGANGAATDNNPAATEPAYTLYMSSGGGAGAGASAAGVAINGTVGGLAGVGVITTPGGAAGIGSNINGNATSGGNGALSTVTFAQGSGGGGGGNCATTTGSATAGAGGNGGIGAGGGGGGTARVVAIAGNIATSGKGGDGGNGMVVVYTYG